MATSLERSGKEGHFHNTRSNTYILIESLVKIGQADHQIICLKGFSFWKNEGGASLSSS